MFTSAVVENAVKANNAQDVNEADKERLLTAVLISVLIMILLNILVGPFYGIQYSQD